MDELRVHNFQELHEALQPYRDDLQWVFRGQRNDPEWRLQPKAGRGTLRIKDQNFFRAWKRWAVAYERTAYQSDWDWLAMAQHHGLATRLLDWTLNPLVAAFFAAAYASEGDSDGAIFAYYDEHAEDAGKPERKPFDIDGVTKVRPQYVTKRLQAQAGIFTIHNPPTLCLEESISPPQGLRKIIIDRSYLGELRSDLSLYGVNERTVFPDLDGLARHMNWWYRSER